MNPRGTKIKRLSKGELADSSSWMYRRTPWCNGFAMENPCASGLYMFFFRRLMIACQPMVSLPADPLNDRSQLCLQMVISLCQPTARLQLIIAINMMCVVVMTVLRNPIPVLRVFRKIFDWHENEFERVNCRTYKATGTILIPIDSLRYTREKHWHECKHLLSICLLRPIERRCKTFPWKEFYTLIWLYSALLVSQNRKRLLKLMFWWWERKVAQTHSVVPSSKMSSWMQKKRGLLGSTAW